MRMCFLIMAVTIVAWSGSAGAATNEGCCTGVVGDVNNSGEGEPTIGDVALLIDAKFISMSCDIIVCLAEADLNRSGGTAPDCSDITLVDISVLIDYLFITGPSLGLPECLSTVTDIDGNVYQTVAIGTHVWMVENLRVTHYRNGDSIPNVTSATAWADLTTGAYCNYSNDTGNVPTYGRLYNWYAVTDSRNLAPEGWHVPTDAEWKQLELAIGMTQQQVDGIAWRGTSGGKLKEAGTIHWASPNTGATDESGFTALPAGQCNYLGGFYNLHGNAYFWSCTQNSGTTALFRSLENTNSGVYRHAWGKETGMSVRCVKD